MYENQMGNQPIGSTVSGNHLTGHTGHGLVGSAKLATPVSKIEQETIALHETVSLLSKVSITLADRVKPVLRQELPKTQGTGLPDEESLPQLASVIRQNRHLIQASVNQLQDILQRLDL